MIDWQEADTMTLETQVQTHRPVVMGQNGMVVSAHPLASQAGLRILQEGGNAMDAAVATAATLNAVEPYMSGVGGLGVLLCYVARENRLRVLNFSGRAPYAATPDHFTLETREVGSRASLVPGNVAGWMTLLETYGSMDRGHVLTPAITYAEHGFPIGYNNHRYIHNHQPLLSRFPTTASIFLPHGEAPRAGTIFKQKALAQSLRAIAEGGREAFYRGPLAKAIVTFLQTQDGLLTLDDFADYQAVWEEPIRTTYRGYDVYAPPPNSSGFQILETLSILNHCDVQALGYGTSSYLHLLMEAAKLSVTDRIAYAGDPEHTPVPLDRLLAPEYAKTQFNRIDWQQAARVMGERPAGETIADVIRPGIAPAYRNGLTTYLSTADREGNIVSLTQTLGTGFGGGLVMGDTGIFLNNMCWWFEIDAASDHPNRVAPGKRVDFCVSPIQVFQNGAFNLSIGTPGSYGILQTTVQMLVHMLDFGMTIQEALELPRFRYFEDRRVEMEDRFPAAVRQEIAALGHQIDSIGDWSPSVGGGQGIFHEPGSGVYQGGADPRRDGYAVGF
jgi:gamma-glutamyltranspeptidase/glutathione hydrolase